MHGYRGLIVYEPWLYIDERCEFAHFPRFRTIRTSYWVRKSKKIPINLFSARTRVRNEAICPFPHLFVLEWYPVYWIDIWNRWDFYFGVFHWADESTGGVHDNRCACMTMGTQNNISYEFIPARSGRVRKTVFSLFRTIAISSRCSADRNRWEDGAEFDFF